MDRLPKVLFVLSLTVVVWIAATASAQPYAGTVLYPTSPPSGFSSASVSAEGEGAAAGNMAGSGSGAGFSSHAVLWQGAQGGTAIDLNPSFLTFSEAWGTNGSQQVGRGFQSGGGGQIRAILWNGSASSAVDLSPVGFPGIIASTAFGTNGSQQVGHGYGTNGNSQTHAFLWKNTAASAVDLNPTSLASIAFSTARGTDGSHQVGDGSNATLTLVHALMWSGTAASAVDLNPTNLTGIAGSRAFGVGGSQQVGYGFTPSNVEHAMIWTGSAASAIDVNPSNVTNSVIYSTNGTQQAGVGDGRAMAWSGTAASAVNLQALLPSGAWTSSYAWNIDSSGNIYGYAYGTYNGVLSGYAVEWTPVPEPTAGFAIPVGCLLLWRRRNKRRDCARSPARKRGA